MRSSRLGITVDHAEQSHPGLDPEKQLNEDAAGTSESPLGLLLVLCDGMGGHSAGEVASRTAIATVVDQVDKSPPGADPGRALRAAIEAANSAVCAIGQGSPQFGRPGSTCVAALFSPSGLVVGHAGDSRAYLLRPDGLERLTRDHSVVGELLAANAITAEQAAAHPNAHQITRALGMQPNLAVDVSGPARLQRGDSVLLCSDGLTDLVGDAEIFEIVRRAQEPAEVCQRLVALALERGGHDNVTVQYARVVEVPDNAPTLLDTQVGSTVGSALPPPAGEPAPTMIDEGHTLVDERGALSETPPLTERVKVAPTVVDHPEGDRATPIAPSPFPDGSVPLRPKPPASLPPDGQPVRHGNALLIGSLGVAAAIVLFVLLWWLAGGGRR